MCAELGLPAPGDVAQRNTEFLLVLAPVVRGPVGETGSCSRVGIVCVGLVGAEAILPKSRSVQILENTAMHSLRWKSLAIVRKGAE